ncbi:Malonyl CoA-acyl carrier protein transacylase [hydrothermal vent metagenome]|uniref:Fatty acid synthase n=1 Tax=hydrothermal vent metagenome TaxID=652676 RepID=A0A3B0XI61_9ZZZZ
MKNSIVISGMSCKFPESASYQEFWQNLLSGLDMVNEDDHRWPAGSFGIPGRFGKIKAVEDFDASFFGVHGKQADKMDPQLRLLLEVSYEAFIDAGIDPVSIKGSNTGVFIGACLSDMMGINGSNIESITGYENTGCSLSMFSNRLSFHYDFHGPSHTLDTACSSSIVALDAAISAINLGKCDIAVVGGSNAIFNPSVSLGFSKLKMLSPTGTCKSFDQSGDGYARSEGIGVIILTRESMAKRVRAHIRGSAVNSDGYTEKGITFPNGAAQQKLIGDLYKSCDINPQSVSYIEAHGTGTAVGDPQEVNAIEQALNIDERSADAPLYIGSVKSNMGHAEGAAGMAGLIKVLLCMEHGIIPANLHYSTPNVNIQSLQKGTIKVIDQHMQWAGGIVGINSFGFGGTNAHVILEGGVEQGDNKPANPRYILPVIPCAARTQEAVDSLLESYQTPGISQDATGFMQSIANRSSELFQYRGCLLYNSSEFSENVEPSEMRAFNGAVVENPLEVWFIYPGMGSQWQGMGKGLMAHPVFSETIQALHNTLENTEINLLQLLTQSEDDSFVKPVKTFVSIAAIQLALTDMAKAYGIKPAGIIGHSIGEVASAYADGAITKEQAILIAYYRGISVQQCPETKGKMLVAQLSWEDAQAYCNHALMAACHNSEYSVTFSGEEYEIDSLAKALQLKGIDVRQVDSTGIAFHSHLIKGAAPILNEYLSSILTEPKKRNHRWISTSHPKSEWCNATICDEKYFVDNLLNPVLFYDALKHIPENAIVIELGPHSLMRASLIDSVSSITYINMMRRGFDCAGIFNDAVAQAYVAGIDIEWTGGLYPRRTQTAQLSLPQLTGWDHTVSWKLPDLENSILRSNADYIYNIDLSREEYGYFKDHKLNSHIVVPGLGYLYLVWQTVSKISRTPFSRLKIQFSDVRFHRATILQKHNSTDLKVRYLPTTHQFEVVERDDLVASGHVTFGDEIVLPDVYLPEKNDKDKAVFMDAADVYKELRLRGYNYGPAFRALNKVSTDGCYIDINWDNNWVTYMDCLLQASVVRFERNTIMPTYIRRMTIDPLLQPDHPVIESYSNKYIRCLSSRSVVIEDCEFGIMPSTHKQDDAVLSSVEFVPFNEAKCIEKTDNTVLEYIQLVNSYILTQASKLFSYAEDKNINIPEHIKKLKKIISSSGYRGYTDDQMLKFESHPNAILLRLAKHVYSQPELLLKDAMPLIVSFDEYNELYKNDIAIAFLYKDKYLGSMIQIVMENAGVSGGVNFCEVGAGTGGITSHILPFLRSTEDSYTITDISGGFFENMKDEFSLYNKVTEYVSWDISEKAPDVRNNLHLVAASNVIHASPNIRQALKNIHDSLADDGFFLLHEVTHGYSLALGVWGFIEDIWNYNDENERSNGAFTSKKRWFEILEESGYDLISTKDDGLLSTLFLCRKKSTKTIDNIVINTNKIGQDLLVIQEKLSDIHGDGKSRLWLKGSIHTTPGLIGMINCARKEGDSDCLKVIFNDSEGEFNEDSLGDIMNTGLAVSVYRDSQWGSFRYLDIYKNNHCITDNAYMDIASKGDLSSLQWVSSPDAYRVNYVYDAYYCALNFKDVMLATGRLSVSAFKESLVKSLSGEFSAVSKDGRRVMGFLNDPFSTKIQIAEDEPPYIWDVPANWTLQQAATVPVAYMTAYLALVVRADIKSGQRVLIHSGTGGVGQASIRVALSRGCEIFTTVGSQQKRELLQSLFPQICSDHIYSSRNTDFESQIMNITQGRGVQVVLNSLADDKLQASLRVLSRYGQFLEIGKYDMTQNTAVGMQMYLRDVKFNGVGLDNVMRDDPESLQAVSDLLKEGVASGVVVPLLSTVFNHDQLEDAFRYMAAGNHTGKVLIKIREEDGVLDTSVNARLKFWCDAGKTYLITGGLGGFGFELARWLIERGAKHIVLTSRSDVKNGYQRFWLNIWKKEGVSVDISNLDVSNKQSSRSLISQIKYPLGGIFHLAMVLDDSFLLNQTEDSFKRVIGVKYDACRHLDELSRELCSELDCFVVFSSLSGGAGNPGQSNYGYANFAMDRLCEVRKKQGFPALSIQWGVIDDVGFANENKEYIDTQALFTKEQSLYSCLNTLDSYLLQDKPVVSSHVRYCDIFDDQENNSHSSENTEEELLQYVKSMLGMSESTQVSDDTKFSTLGMDSLMVVEIKNKLETDYSIRLTLPATQQLNFSTLKELFKNKISADDVSSASDKRSNSVVENEVLSEVKKEVFDLFAGCSDDSNIVYFLNGFASDPVSVLSDLNVPENSRVYIVRYEQAGNMNKLADLWEQHIVECAPTADKIHVVGFSTGATITHRFKKLKDLSHLSVNIEYTTISTPVDAMFEPLGVFSVGAIDALPEEDAMSRISELSWFGDFSMISHREIIDQIKFIVTDHFYAKELSPVDRTIIPGDDDLCWTVDKAKLMSSHVEQVDGVHNLKTLPLYNIMFN